MPLPDFLTKLFGTPNDVDRTQMLGQGGLAQQAAQAKSLRAKQIDDAVNAAVNGPQAGAQPPQGPVPPQGQMSQSQFFRARSPEERGMQQQLLIQKLRSLGQ